MKKSCLLPLFLFIISTFVLVSAVSAQSYAQNELLVRFEENVSEARIAEINQSSGTEIKNIISVPMKIYLLEIINGASVPDMIRAYGALSEIKYAEPNFILLPQ